MNRVFLSVLLQRSWSMLRARPTAAAGVLLLVVTGVAMIWANSGAAASYQQLWQTEFSIGIEGFALSKPLLLWINDLLMAVFFLLVGLEIKREILQGELSTFRRAALPVAAALGGVVLPALVYLVVNSGAAGDASGWAVPAATDIAFALGILALLGSRIPLSVKVFLTSVAVFDDLAAVLIIAAFFTSSVSWVALLGAGAVLLALFAVNRVGVRRFGPYIGLGAALWLCVLASGLHATLAGVLLAATIPMGRALDARQFGSQIQGLTAPLQREAASAFAPDSIVHRVRNACDQFESPLVRWEHGIQSTVLFLIVPIFALANSGVSLDAEAGPSSLPVGAGVALGLLLGKPLGITLFAWLAVKLGWAALPAGMSWRQLHATSWLAGVGFTMSLFVSGLALSGQALEAARLGLLIGSAAAACVGSFLLWRTCDPASIRADEERLSSQPSEAADPLLTRVVERVEAREQGQAPANNRGRVVSVLATFAVGARRRL